MTTSPDERASDRARIAALLYPDATSPKTPADYEALYPPRDLPHKAMVTRYAPSPTGFMHIGGIFVSLINARLAAQTGGVFYLRIEDTDQRRTIEGALDTIIDSYTRFGITPDEGVYRTSDGSLAERGAYGPYVQTARATIYRDYAIDLLKQGKVYPCFLTAAEIDELRKAQMAKNIKPGVHGVWAKWRDAPSEAVAEELKKGTPFVIRLRAPDDTSGRIEWKDGVKDVISMPVNDVDMVLIKSDGIPTYHFAHAVDDHLMRTTHVIRGDEWMSSVPLHLQLFQMLGVKPPHYAHVPPIQKLESTTTIDEVTGESKTSDSRRKLSKRSDPEANVAYYREVGVPESATIDYLLNIANSAFEEWRTKNPTGKIEDFPLKLSKLAPGGALSDLVKLRSISKDVIGRMSGADVFREGLAWAKIHDPELAALMEAEPEYATRALDIERNTKKGNKRVVTFQDVRTQLNYFFDALYDRIETWEMPENVPPDDLKWFALKLAEAYDPTLDRDAWFAVVKGIAAERGYASEVKEAKAHPEKYKGHAGDVAMIVRVALCGTRQSPDLAEVMSVLGPDRVRRRLLKFA